MGAPLTPTDSFAPVSLLGAYLQETIDDDDPMANAALEAATAAIQSYCDQRLTLVEDDVAVVDGSGSDTLLLPEFPVTDVSVVVVDSDWDSARTLLGPGNGSASEYDWNEAGLLFRRRGQFVYYESRFEAVYGMWPPRRKSVTVTYTHGYEVIPADIRLVTAAVAARAWAQDGANSETTGSYTVQYAGQPGTLTEYEKSILDRYRARRR